MTKTGLDKRIALVILSKLGKIEPRRYRRHPRLYPQLVPSTTARSLPRTDRYGYDQRFDVPLKSKFAGMLMITVAQVDRSGTSIKTAAAQKWWP
ncbi:MAG: hypothetical protein ACLRXQ_13220 [Phascolarctobacterium faecium]